MKYIKLNTIFFIAVLILAGCEAEIDQYTPDSGEADLSSYVAIGNSLTAGYTDGDLFRSGQENSLGMIIAGQLMHAGLENFKQPMMKDENGFGNRLVLAQVDGSPLPVPRPGTPDPGNFENIFQQEGPFHNMGVPGAKTSHLLFEGYGSLNPYYGRFASDPVSGSVIKDALALQPSFFTLWTGSNDILGFALGGGEGEGITPTEEFSAALQTIVAQLTANGARGAVANIADITRIPFFSAIPYDALALMSQGQVDMLNAGYAEAPHIEFSFGRNPIVVADQSHPAGIRQIERGELVLLTAMQGMTANGWGSSVPLAPEYYLNLEQVSMIKESTGDYNSVIEQLTGSAGLAHVDVASLLRAAETGIYFDAIAFNTQFVSGGLFSLDGVHLTARGYAIVANEFIAEINRAYNASIPKVAVGNFPGIVFP